MPIALIVPEWLIVAAGAVLLVAALSLLLRGSARPRR
jgi:hypothetical protein